MKVLQVNEYVSCFSFFTMRLHCVLDNQLFLLAVCVLQDIDILISRKRQALKNPESFFESLMNGVGIVIQVLQFSVIFLLIPSIIEALCQDLNLLSSL